MKTNLRKCWSTNYFTRCLPIMLILQRSGEFRRGKAVKKMVFEKYIFANKIVIQNQFSFLFTPEIKQSLEQFTRWFQKNQIFHKSPCVPWKKEGKYWSSLPIQNRLNVRYRYCMHICRSYAFNIYLWCRLLLSLLH